MSYFPTQLLDDRPQRNELPDSIVVERRTVLQVSLGALAALTLRFWHPAHAQQTSEAQTLLSWDDLVQRAIPLAEQLIESLSPDEEAYLIRLSDLIKRRQATPRAYFDLARPVGTFESLRRLPLVVLQFRLAPGAEIPHHDHRDYNGVLTVIEGVVRIRSFELLDPDSSQIQGCTFQIRETEDVVLMEGAQSTLSRSRGNIHALKAGPKGARLIDFFTFFREGAHSVYLNVSEKPSDPVKLIFDATWA